MLASGINATIDSDKLTKLLDTAKAHKDAWIDFSKGTFGEKFDLLKTQHDEMFELIKKEIQAIAALTTIEDRDTLLKTITNDTLDLLKKHHTAWKDWHNKKTNTATNLGKTQETELNNFK